ncbi:hypothetical protein [Sphingosinicella rhizophila]|uniref:Uncharacterized protein n=1 Tax=Sphingosinicella rhizophila TaxID=3050082 RepID=A0ABU3Q311_9SPHN|nr:hypothetical protein [Sphingosinicella sp. GR2756]MDT9597355.1 hypothetical protein [Sphingosinicella sp. GR2756]
MNMQLATTDDRNPLHAAVALRAPVVANWWRWLDSDAEGAPCPQ